VSMIRFLLRRLSQAVATLVIVSIMIFIGVFAIGNPVYVLIDPNSSPEVIEQTIRNLGLDRPLHEQYWRFAVDALQGNFGTSYVHAEPSLRLIASRLPATLELVLAGLFIAASVGFPLGLIAGYWTHSRLSRLISSLSVLGISVPTFWIALMLIMVFSLEWRLLPTGGRGATEVVFGIETSLVTIDGLRHVVLPALTLSLFPMALIVRLTRAGIREHRRVEYVRFARAMGLTPTRILCQYMLRNILIPIVTILGIVLGTLIAFAVVTETIFAWPGMGKLIIDSIKVSDRPVIVAYLLFVVAMFLVINFLVDLVSAALDPRIRLIQRA
jgi:peptide/nickel transport system permease protein